ncbi:MAG: nucleotidyltransferase family protein [Alkalispirochaeta sp.]
MDCIIPAAGASQRMGTPKQTAIINGRPLLSIAVENALATCSRCIVVTGAHRSEAQTAIPRLPEVEEIYNADYQRGMITSIAVGAERVRSPWFFVAPGDMPRLAPGVFAALLEAAGRHDPERGPVAFFPVYRERRGHPVLISRCVIPELQRHAAEYRSMRDFLSRYDVADVAVSDAGIVFDVDTPEDVESAEDAGRERDK